jgi:hypothetical protein
MDAIRLLAAAAASLLTLGGCGDASYRRVDGEWHYEDQPVPTADPKSFKPLNATFARDAQRAFYRGSPVPGSEGSSFEALSEHEARDRRAVYWADTYRKGQEYWSIRHLRIVELVGADPASYRVLGHGYSRDHRQAWFEGEPFKVRDVASFEPLNAMFARDRLHGYYERMEIADSDGASFTMVDERDLHYARDRYRVYHARIDIDTEPNRPRPVVTVVRGVDPATFRVPERQP